MAALAQTATIRIAVEYSPEFRQYLKALDALDRIVIRTQIANAITYCDFPKAERLIQQYVDQQLAHFRTH